MRAHYSRALTDDAGNLIPGCVVRLVTSGTTASIGDTVFVNDTTSDTLTNPFTTVDGNVDFYLDSQARIRLGITRPEPGSSEFFVDGVDVLSPP